MAAGRKKRHPLRIAALAAAGWAAIALVHVRPHPAGMTG
jgi:hypothetical protein